MNLTIGKYKIYQKRNIITVSVNEGYVTEARIINKHSDEDVEGTPRVVTVHKDPPKVDYREVQHSRYALPLIIEKSNIFLLGVFVGSVLALLLLAWFY